MSVPWVEVESHSFKSVPDAHQKNVCLATRSSHPSQVDRLPDCIHWTATNILFAGSKQDDVSSECYGLGIVLSRARPQGNHRVPKAVDFELIHINGLAPPANERSSSTRISSVYCQISFQRDGFSPSSGSTLCRGRTSCSVAPSPPSGEHSFAHSLRPRICSGSLKGAAGRSHQVSSPTACGNCAASYTAAAGVHLTEPLWRRHHDL